jgi:hypothetical protein
MQTKQKKNASAFLRNTYNILMVQQLFDAEGRLELCHQLD